MVRLDSLFLCAAGCLVLAAPLSIRSLDADEYHIVPKSGDDANAGSAEKPWKTLRFALTRAKAGDTLTLHEGTYPDESEPAAKDGGKKGDGMTTFLIETSGEPGKPITIRRYKDDKVVIAAAPNGFTLPSDKNLSHFVFDGLEFRNCPRNGIAAWADHIVVRNCVFDNAEIAVKNNDKNKRHHHLLIESCALHWFRDIPIFPDNMDKVVIRNNVICVARSVAMDPGGIGDLVVENNFVVQTGKELGALKIRWGNVEPLDGPNCNGAIVRRNVFLDGGKYVMLLASANGATVYSNVLANLTGTPLEAAMLYMQRDAVDIAPGKPDGPNKRNAILNNIIYNLGPGTPPQGAGNTLVSMTASMSADFKDQRMDHNLYFKAGDGGYVTLGRERLAKEAVKGWCNGYDANSLVGVEPSFADPRYEAGPEGFRVKAGSPCLDAGTSLTAAAGGGEGKVIRVADARYFTDGCDMIPGDLVRIGANPPVRVTARDIKANTLTLEKAVTWKDGDPVSLDYKGKAPDIGAFEEGMEVAVGNAPGIERFRQWREKDAQRAKDAKAGQEKKGK